MKLSPWVIYVIGVFAGAPILAFGWFGHAGPNAAETKNYENVYDQLTTESAKQSKADQRRKNAQEKVRQAVAEWTRMEQVRTPPMGLDKGGSPTLAENAYQLSVDTPKFRDNVQRAVNAQLHAGGVKIISGPWVPGPTDVNAANELLDTFYNYGNYGFPVLVMKLGQVEVEGKSYKQIFDHVKAWSNMPHYLAVTDSLTLSGTSPSITGTYNLTVVAFVRGRVIAPEVPEQPTGGGAAGGMMGGGGNMAAMFGGGGPGGAGGPRNRMGGPPMGAPGGAPRAAAGGSD